MQTAFSVIMSVYKNDDSVFFDRALQSISAFQSVLPDEILLVIDGAIPDALTAVVEKYRTQCSFFRTIQLKKNGGLGNALRIAVENSSHEIIARMDSDDVSVPDRFEQQLNYLTLHPEVDLVGGDIAEFIDDEANIVSYRKVPEHNAEIREYMKKRCPLNHVSVMFKKHAVWEAGNYLDWFWNEDYYLWVRMAETGCQFANTGTVLVNVRTGSDTYKRRGGKKYYQSEKGIQKYMLDKNMISRPRYLLNVFERWVIQVGLPNGVRGWMIQNFARKRR